MAKTKKDYQEDLADAQRLLREMLDTLSSTGPLPRNHYSSTEHRLDIRRRIEYHLFSRCAHRSDYPHGRENRGKEPQ